MTTVAKSRPAPTRLRRSARLLLTGIAPFLAIGPVMAQAADAPEQRAAKLVAAMTIEEKASLLLNTSPGVPRLNIPAYQWWNEGLHGVHGEPNSTNFPEPIGLAATFDAPLLHDVAGAITQEAVAISDRLILRGRRMDMAAGRDLWSPNINIFRDPRWGRGQETYGEDPFLTARLGVAYVTGIQGPDASKPINIATPKHFAVHSGPEPTRHQDNVDPSVHDLRDTYFPAFRAAVTEGKAGSVMCSYNAVGGIPACANPFLLQTTLRDAWGFKGLVVSDCDAIDDIWVGHKFVKDGAAAAGAAVRAGTDNVCSVAGFFDRTSFGRDKDFVTAVKRGDLSVAELDRAVVRTLTARIRTGSLDRVPVAPAAAAVNGPAARALALTTAEKSLVLLKNDGVLPLAARPMRVAVIGPLADATRALRGNYNNRDTVAFTSIFGGLKAALPKADVRLVPAGESWTDGNIVPASALSTEDGKPGITVRYYPALPKDGPPARSLIEKVIGTASGRFATEPSLTMVRPSFALESFATPEFADGGRIVASGYLVPPVSGLYRIGIRGLNGELTFDGKPAAAVQLAPLTPTLAAMKTVALEAGKRYPVQVSTLAPGAQFVELDWQRVTATPEADVVAAAKDADVIVAVVGIDSSLESEEGTQNVPGFKGGDRTSLDLPADQVKLLAAAKATGKPLVVINVSGSAINLDWAKQNADAILQAWYPGEAGGTAVGRVVAGLANPGGRLPVTFYKDVAQLPAFNDYAMTGRTYRYFTGQPVYPFGYGLSYTRFAYGAAKVTARGRSAADGVVVEAALTNTGARSGDEVAQVYLDFPDAPGVPRIALRGFQRVTLAPGETRRLRFELSPRDLSSVSPEGKIRVLAGAYRIHVGGAQPGAGVATVSAPLAIAKTVDLPD